jgi:hypothetical protein
MVLPVHLQHTKVVAIDDYLVRDQFTGIRPVKPDVPQSF